MADDQKLLSDVKYKQFVAAVDKSLKNFEYSSEWADLISCLGRLNKIIQTYSQYAAVPRKLLIGKRLAQCLHPALPSGVHLKALESYDLIFSQIGPARLAQDLFIYTSGLFPLLSQASMSVKPVLLDLYETHLLPLKKKLYPGLSGFLLALLPGIEEVSEYTERTVGILTKLCSNTDESIFFSCLWDCVLHSTQTRLPAMTFVLTYMNKNKNLPRQEIMGSDVNLMVNALCASFDDTNVLVQRITLDFVISFVSFHNTILEKSHLVKLLTYGLGVFLRRDMSLNRRLFQWLLNVNSEGNIINGVDLSLEDQSDTDASVTETYFDKYSKDIVVASVVILFHDVLENHHNYIVAKQHNTKKKFSHLKPFRILITLLDRPEVGSVILENVMLEVLRILYKHQLIKEKHIQNTTKDSKTVQIMHDELIKNANLLFNSFEAFFLWDYIGRTFHACSNSLNTSSKIEGKDSSTNLIDELVPREKPNFTELFRLTSYILDVVSLETSFETQSEHWPLLFKLIIDEMVSYITQLSLEAILDGVLLLSKLLSKLSPHMSPLLSENDFDIKSTILQKNISPPVSPTHELEYFSGDHSKSFNNNPIIIDCITLSKNLFLNFVTSSVLKNNIVSNLSVETWNDHNCSIVSLNNATSNQSEATEDRALAECFQMFCRYLVQLSCFPVNLSNQQELVFEQGSESLEEWLHALLCCCCYETSFNIQNAAVTCLLDLINVVLTTQQKPLSPVPSVVTFIPLILSYNLCVIEKSNFYELLAGSLWKRICPTNSQYHQCCVDLFLRLHNITPTPVCDGVVSKSLVSTSKDEQEIAHWRFSVMWHLSREFYRDDNNKANKGIRTLDKCLLHMMDSLQSHNKRIREYSEHWIKHCVAFSDIGRLIEPLLLVLLSPTSCRIAVQYAWKFNDASSLKKFLPNDKIIESVDQLENTDRKEVITSNEKNIGESGDEEDESDVNTDNEQHTKQDEKEKEIAKKNKSLPTHPLLVHKLYYTQRYDTQQCLYSLQRIHSILDTEGHAFLCAAATNSMSSCNTPHQALLRELLIRHRKVLAGNEFYGKLVEAHQLLIRASTAKYLEILLSVCLYYIRSEYLDAVDVTDKEMEDNFTLQTTSAEVLTKITDLLLEIAVESGKGFASYINDLLFRSKIQRIALHCLLSTVYAITSDYKDCTETGFYCMVECPNIAQYSQQEKRYKNQVELRKSILKFIQSLIFLEHRIGTENVTDSHVIEKSKRSKRNTNNKKIGLFEYVSYKPIVSQPMFISASLTVLREKQWIHLHNDWMQLLVSCLPKFEDEMVKLIVPVVEQICDNIKYITNLYEQSYQKKSSISNVHIPPDYMLTLLSNLTSFCQYCLINTAQSTISMMAPRIKQKDESSSSMFSNFVNVFSSSSSIATEKTNDEEAGSSALMKTRDGLLGSLPSVLTAVLMVWNAWDSHKISKHDNNVLLATDLPLAIGDSKTVRISILQLITPIAMNHTSVFLSSVAEVWCIFRDVSHGGKLTNELRGKEWITASNKRYLPDANNMQKVLLEIVQAIKALSLQTIIETSRQVFRNLITLKERTHAIALDICFLQFLYELLLKNSADDIIQIKSHLLLFLKDCFQVNITPSPMFVMFAIFNIFVHRVPVPEERRARRELQELAQKFVESFNHIAAASLEGSAWFRRSLQVVTQLDHSSDLEESTLSERSSIPDVTTPSNTTASGLKNSMYSISAILVMAEFLPPLFDLLYLSEEKDKIASSLVYLMYNIVPYLKNHGQQNYPGFRACSALLAAISDYQYTLRAWKKDCYELFLDNDFFNMDKISFGFWRIIIDRLITYDSTIFKDLMQKISLSQSGAINIFANREQEMEQRALLLKRLSLIIFCGEFDQYHQSMPDIQERLAESIRQLQGPFLHEQVFLCFRVLIARMSPNHLVSLWPPILTELVLVFVHMEHEVSNANKPKSKSKLASLDSFLGTNGYIKDPSKWLRLYLAVCKLFDFLLILPSDILPHYQVYKWAFSETPGIFYVKNFEEIENSVCVNEALIDKDSNEKDKCRSKHGKKDDEVSKMAQLNAPITQQMKHAFKEKQKLKHKQNSKQDNMKSFFLPYISRILKVLRHQNTSHDTWQPIPRDPGQLLLRQTKISSVSDLIPFFLAVSGEAAASDVEVTKFSSYTQKKVEDLIENDFLNYTI